MSETLVIRFGSLGDLCLLGWALAERRDNLGSSSLDRITLVTKPAYADLMGKMRGIDQVLSPRNNTAIEVARLAGVLKGLRFPTILDAHNILRGHLLLGLMGRRADRRLAKDTASRLMFLRTGKASAALQRTMIQRFGDVVSAGCDPSLEATTQPPLAHLSSHDHPAPGILGLAPGAQWDSKRWPAAHYSTLAGDFLQHSKATIRIFLGPREQRWFSTSSLAPLAADPRVKIIREDSLVEVAKLMGECNILVTNDSGLLHLCEAAGTPVLALFGPTVREFGYFPHLSTSRVMEITLGCRPCSRNGKRPCHRGDLACLENISPGAVLEQIQAMWTSHSPGPTS